MMHSLRQHERSPGKDSPPVRIRPRLLSDRIPTFVPKGNPLGRQEKQTKNEKEEETQRSSSPSSDSPSSTFSKAPSWIWTLETAPLAPIDVPLERTAIELRDVPLSMISARISAFMKEYSMNCAYRSHEARVDCSTCCGLKFVVQLWRKQVEDEPTPFIVEVQRRKGCCIVMRTVRRLLYQAVLKHNDPDSPPQASSSSVSSRFLELKRRLVGRNCIQKAETNGLETQNTNGGCRVRCLELLASEKMDCVRLGMETLLVLVTPELAGVESAEEIAQALLFGKGDLVMALRPAFLSLYQLTNEIATDEDEDAVSVVSSLECCATTVTDYERQKLRLLLLKVLSAALDIVNENEQVYLCNEATSLLDLTASFWQQTLSYLLVRLEECDKGQHEAALAAKCFCTLESLQPNLLIPLTQSAIVDRARKAYTYGKQHHLLLERESEKLLKSLHLSKNS
ncbi:MAG: hypothetical protein SGILL_010362 [Bacillariaceae sp.]